jgi:Arc/MetJ-type ribon-helix-helix transcriptional regulator
MRPLFSFRWRSSGSTVGRSEAIRRLVRFAPVQEEEEDSRLGREGKLGQPRGRGPVGRWGAAG